MANDNHETYQGVDISTYTDTIDNDNSFTVEEIEACVLSAGVVPFNDPRILPLGEYNQSVCTGTNIYSPFYKETDPSMILWIDDTGMVHAEANNYYWYKHIVYVSVNQASNFIATDLTINKYKNFLTVETYQQTVDGVTYTLYAPSVVTKYGAENDWHNSLLSPMFLLTAGGTVAVSQKLNTLMPICSWAWAWGEGTLTNSLDIIGAGIGDQRNLMDGSVITLGDCIWEALNEEPYPISENVPEATFPRVHVGDHFTHIYLGGNPLSLRYGYNNIDDILLECAFCGLMFEYEGVTYKPLAENGVVYGYTSDMSKTSEWDDWKHIGDHEIPVTPPTPPVPPGYDDDPWHGVSFSGVGVGGAGAFAKCYYMTSTELANLRSWMNSNNVPEGFDPMAQIIGLSQVPVNLSGDDNTTVQFVNSSAVYDPGVTRLVDSGVSTQISMGTPKRYSLGSVNITRRMQERGEPYLDYDCQVELYLPLIGMFSLDTQAVMGRTITAEAVLDPISGTLAAYAYVTRDGQNLPIAYGSTTIGVDLPITAQQYSVARAALKQANAQLGTSLLSSTLSFIAAATAGGKGSGTGAKTATGSTNGLAAAGIREAGADYMKASQAGNVFGDFMQWGRAIRQLSYGNNTAIAGSFGGSAAQWSYPFTPYVKIIRPRYEKPSNYNHSQGVPCVQTKKVGSCTGFIQCIGVDVSGISGATDIELQAIQAALANGVFAGGGA